jgi:Kef-type K+ transport system membrane component KefB
VSQEDAASFYVQLGAIVFVLAFGARLAGRLGLSPVPLYLLAVPSSGRSTSRRSAASSSASPPSSG